ncbi:MAG: hypothetical protein AABX13_03105 [Nanoarchaeota archaeon]
MKLTIDTQQDSYEDIRKVLQILTSILGRKGNASLGERGEAGEETIDTTNLMSMFNGSADSTKATDVSSLLNPTRQEKRGMMERVEVY